MVSFDFLKKVCASRVFLTQTAREGFRRSKFGDADDSMSD